MDELQLIINWRCLQRVGRRERGGDAAAAAAAAENVAHSMGAIGNLRCSSWSPQSDCCVPGCKKNEVQLAETCPEE